MAAHAAESVRLYGMCGLRHAQLAQCVLDYERRVRGLNVRTKKDDTKEREQ